ncbi:acetyl-CoA carboxylase biotin carboxyl carrier protein [Sporosarcina pasteurii]|uniref:Biotin carboxyl carrier protein of acetyl-CoA carboxylase n=1 Tax=Sporosarcina pasteurii TaxID=1474 RepID=A0A380BRJ6_SPOPA|nr:acetyl-CoA carboxylase biotin carboxyl carrier protein [Sporosarcina pasteurii]MDS9471102.1 acetyl-CoA carboxylase biotin carboxyl carrier protein [Sporosarcina pasteurii]QBQ05255.1 acetyl-CoA carboxylase biotin carboxyl carrier protein [Sporosarcina pasteurii]SUJ04754.1 Biotin carboxyl carrier protein of acetyl-CoA carboxylase [Sporosarcina pasteurii]
MLKIQEIREIIKLIDKSSIEKFSYEADNTKVVLKKGSNGQTVVPVQVEQVEAQPVVTPVPEVKVEAKPQPVQQEIQAAPEVEVVHDESMHEVTSPMVGTFYAASSPEADAYVKIGDKVSDESVVCIVEAMKLFNEIEAEVSGEIVEILVKDGQLVEYGQPLFLVKTN